MSIVLTDDLQQLLSNKVANGQFPDEEAVVKEALRQFLFGELLQGRPPTCNAPEIQMERLPGPFLEDESVVAPADLLVPDRGIARTTVDAARRLPDRLPGE